MKKLLPISSAALVLWTLHTAWAGVIPGKLLNPKGIPAPHIYTSVNIAGEYANPPSNSTTATGNDGIFYFPNLPAGTYTQGFSEKESFEALYRKAISVPASGDATYTEVSFNPASYCYGTYWFPDWHTWYAQSFRATGENVISVGLRTAGSNGPDISVAILDGDNPYASQIGPTRALGVSSTNAQCAYWSAGEVPTVPGQIYTVKFTVEGGGQFSPWHQTVRTRMRSETPDSRTWADGVEIYEPLEMTVNMDDAGLINTMCCARCSGYTVIGAGGYAGQTFTAEGSSVIMVTWLTGSSAKWAVSIHDGAGTGGGGAQIGPTKYVYGVAWDGRAVVTWAPNEVPSTPGHVYYVKLRMADGSSTVIYNARGGDEYAGGQGFNTGSALSYDLGLGVYEEKYSGALDQPTVKITNFRVESVGATTATVTWDTLWLADTTVDYGENTPYALTHYDSTPSFSHTAELTGLKPNTLYHARGISRASGHKQGRTKDVTFVTLPDRPNLLADPGFESGTFGAWTSFGAQFAPAGWFGGSGPRTGDWAVGGATNGLTIQGGVYQRVMAIPGERYKLSAWVYTYCTGDLFSEGWQTITRIGIDPTGGTDPASSSIVWSPYTNSQQTWTQVATSALAASNYITVFLYGGNQNSVDWSVYTYDDTVLTGPMPTSASAAQAVADYPDGAFLSVSGVKCTATSTQLGGSDYYVEALDRSSAIRVSTADIMSVGDQVTVTGTLETRATGERQLSGAAVNSRAASTALAPMCARLNALGGGSPGAFAQGIPGTLGPYNVGMLMRVSGRVTAAGGGCVYVNDGSLPGDGLKIDTTSVTNVPAVAEMVGVTGIVRLEGTAGAAVPLLTPRNNADVQVF